MRKGQQRQTVENFDCCASKSGNCSDREKYNVTENTTEKQEGEETEEIV